MCFSVGASLVAWLIANSIAVHLFIRNQNYDRWNAGFIAVFTLIQLLEAGLWNWLDNEHVNSVFTMLVLLVLYAQPLAQSYFGYLSINQQFLLYLAYFYFFIWLYGVWRIATSEYGQFFTEVGDKGHLVWKDSKHPNLFIGNGFIAVIYLLGLFVPLIFMSNFKGWPLIIVGLVTAIYSWAVTQGQEFSSMWCLTAIAYSIVALYL